MAVRRAEIQRHLDVLVNDIGARPTGSWYNQQAASYLEQTLSQSGYGVKKQKFRCLDWHTGPAVLVAEEQKLALVASDYSAPCDSKGEIRLVGSMAELQSVDGPGLVLVLHGDLTKEALSPKNFRFYNPQRHQDILAGLEACRPSGIITVSFDPDRAVPIIEDGDFDIPCAVVPGNKLDVLRHLAGTMARLFIGTRRRCSHGENIIGTVGSEGGTRVLSAHFDTKPTTPGALDNASGTAVLLALAGQPAVKKAGGHLEFVFFNGEDYYSNPGETVYYDSRLQDPSPYQWALNVDGVGLRGSPQGAAVFCWPERWPDPVNAVGRSSVQALDPWPQGDHMLFAMQGVPTAALTSKGVFNLIDTVIHTEKDGMHLLDIGVLQDVAHWIEELLRIDWV